MSVKRRLKSLAAAQLVSDDAVARLKEYSISSVEELVGVLGAQRGAIAKLLNLSDAETDELETKARDALGGKLRQRYDEDHDRAKPAFGAQIPPDD